MIRATGAYTKAVVAWSWKANECELLLETDTGPRSVLAPRPPFASPAQAYDVEYDATPCGLVVRRWHATGWDEARLLEVLHATPNKDVVELWKALGMKGKPQPAVLVDVGKSRNVSVLDHGLKMRGLRCRCAAAQPRCRRATQPAIRSRASAPRRPPIRRPSPLHPRLAQRPRRVRRRRPAGCFADRACRRVPQLRSRLASLRVPPRRYVAGGSALGWAA